MGKPRDLANVVATGNILADGAVAPAELTGVNATAAELNILDGVTATAAELNLMDGVTATTAELNYVDGVTSNVQTQIDTKAPTANPTFTGTATAPTINASTALQIGGAAITATAAELNKMDGVTVSASDINTVTAKAPIDGATFTGTTTIPTADINGGAIDGAIIGANSAAAVTATTVNASTKLQVNSTDVITNARQLSNIASIDATTAAAITAGGVGGGGTLSFTATGAISAGQVVALRSDGTIEVIAQSQSSAPTAENTTEVSANFYSYLTTAYDSTNNKVVICYVDQDQSNYVYARAGAISGSTIVWESEQLVYGNNSLVGAAVYDPDQDRTLVFLKRTATDDEVYVYGLDSSGTTISNVGQLGNIQSNSNINSYAAVYDTNANKTIFVIETGGPSTHSYVCTLTGGSSLDIQNSGSTCSKAEGNQIVAHNSEHNVLVFDSNENKVVFMYNNSANNNVYASVGTISGTSCSWAGNTSWMSNHWSNPQANFDTNANKFIVLYVNSNGSLRANVGTVSSGSLSFGTQVTIDSNTASGFPQLAFDGNTNRFLVVYRVHTSNNGIAAFATISGTSITVGSFSTFSTNGNVYSPSQAKFLVYDDNAQKFVIMYRVSDNDYQGTVIAGVSSNVSNWIGVAAEAISDGASGDITILGGVNENQSSLTINTVYYAQPTGGIGTTSQDFKVGRAISATKILVTEGNA